MDTGWPGAVLLLLCYGFLRDALFLIDEWLMLGSELVALFVWKGALTVILIIESCSSI